MPLRTHPIGLGDERDAVQERIIGGLEVINKLSGRFSNEDVLLVEMLATQAATILEVANLYLDLDKLSLDLITALTSAVDAKDHYTRGHSQRVSAYAVAIAEKLALDPETIHHVRIGGLLHDIGKIGVPDDVLKKIGPLTDPEYNEIKKHPTIGEKIIGQVDRLKAELPILAEHHERLDGKGYPRGLKDQDISLLGRIVAVADAFDAMASDRAYRNALSVDEALQRLIDGAGTQFDPTCVQALIAVYRQGRITVPNNQQPDSPEARS